MGLKHGSRALGQAADSSDIKESPNDAGTGPGSPSLKLIYKDFIFPSVPLLKVSILNLSPM
ncbi:hypothetical protein Csa_007048 [Cucumis sativus]|uniref:Uncharacterized protein n=1 Tax=Cucumis sativus TaxID=3659 RepID=A0A0A0LWP1_CUCSA|nr:hypothetical protein Csa_007048 [Cucumis sativus]